MKIIKISKTDEDQKDTALTQVEMRDKFIDRIMESPIYKKNATSLVRKAEPGEKIITNTSDGKETENVAKEGDFVVQNNTKAKEQYIISSKKLSQRYIKISDDTEKSDGFQWEKYKAIGQVNAIQYRGSNIKFKAPWEEDMTLKNGDMLASTDGKEVYRIALSEFKQTYCKAKDK